MAPIPNTKKTKPKKHREKLAGVIKRPRRLFTYKEEDLINAILSIRNKAMGFREACRFYGVPFATVHDRLSGKVAVDKKPRVGPDPVLGVQGEEKLTKWIVDMAKCGFPLSKQDLIENVSKIIAKSGAKTPFKDGKPGDTWYQKFLRRHPEISIREPEGINNARAAITENRIRHWFKDLQEFVKSIDAADIFEEPDRIFNGDETGFSLCPKSGKVLGPKGYKNLYIIKKNNEKENITVLIVFSASGKLCPPLVVFPYVRPPKALVDKIPESWVLGRSDSGWMKSDVFYEYVSNDFNAWLTKNDIKRPILLFVDGHKSHMSFALSEFCQENGIILYALPPNSTHMLQPADVSVFRPLKQNWKSTVKQWQSENVNQVVTKLNFCSILHKTLAQSQLEDAIKNGFRKCGLFPLDENSVDYTKCVKDAQQRINGSAKKTANIKEFESAKKVITMIKDDLAKHNIDSETILVEIEKAKERHIQNRQSKSKTPRNSAVSNQSSSIITNEVLRDITPENFNFNEPESTTSYIEINTPEFLPDTLFADKNVSLPELGSYVSLNDISVMSLNEIQMASQMTDQDSPGQVQVHTFTVSADVHAEKNDAVSNDSQKPSDQIISFAEVFETHLHFPEPPAPKDKKRNGPKLPSAISSQAWRDHYKKKETDKENRDLEKKRKQQMKAEEKEKKAMEKDKKGKKNKALPKKTPKEAKRILCSECTEELVSDVEDDSEKNIGCDKCIRWFHLKCTEMCDKPYGEAALTTYKCPFCQISATKNS